ncbi:MAG: prepilin-type N-terminal cleavage/methylation domain-containing protein [Phycisphaerae bacterium]|nr:prepilin-type N-terminal cleavage/methylation domain-containing protein [Phycisphaerae bacterium]
MQKNKKALTFIEVIIAVAIVAIAVLGTMAFRYYCNINARLADVKMTASRVGLLLLEDWKATMGSPAYDPTRLSSDSVIWSTPSDVTKIRTGTGAGELLAHKLGDYEVETNHAVFNATLSYYDDLTDDVPLALNVHITWSAGVIEPGSFSMTTYAY